MHQTLIFFLFFFFLNCLDGGMSPTYNYKDCFWYRKKKKKKCSWWLLEIWNCGCHQMMSSFFDILCLGPHCNCLATCFKILYFLQCVSRIGQAFFRCLLATSNMAFLFLNVSSWHLVDLDIGLIWPSPQECFLIQTFTCLTCHEITRE